MTDASFGMQALFPSFVLCDMQHVWKVASCAPDSGFLCMCVTIDHRMRYNITTGDVRDLSDPSTNFQVNSEDFLWWNIDSSQNQVKIAEYPNGDEVCGFERV